MQKSRAPLRVLHTADWHIGRTLHGRKRYDEFAAFLDWMAAAIEDQRVDILLIAGDVFDTSTPSNRAQELYYRFLCKIAGSCCRHVVVTGGNHDSPTFLNAPQQLLRALNIHVVGSATDCREDEVLLLHTVDGQPELLVCAVPYLRDRDVRTAEPGESIEDKERKIYAGIREHYHEVCAIAEKKRQQLERDIPLVAMGHLFAAGGKTQEDDGVRELYVGSLAHVTADVFPLTIDYLALGHLHVPQKVNGSQTMRYSGSPLPMGFGEARQQKSVCVVEFSGRQPTVELLPIPSFQSLVRVEGDWAKIQQDIQALKKQKHSFWIEVDYQGEEIIGDLHERLDAEVADTLLDILRVGNNRIKNSALLRTQTEETLDDLDVYEVFARCLEEHAVPTEQQADLVSAYKEIVQQLQEKDWQAE